MWLVDKVGAHQFRACDQLYKMEPDSDMKQFLGIHRNIITSAAAANGPKCVVRKMNGLSAEENKDISINHEEIDCSGKFDDKNRAAGTSCLGRNQCRSKAKNLTHGYLHKWVKLLHINDWTRTKININTTNKQTRQTNKKLKERWRLKRRLFRFVSDVMQMYK